jgi:hypothetical protein
MYQDQTSTVTIRVIWLVGFSVEVILPSLVQAGEASLWRIAFFGFDIAVLN